jgi:type IV secretory pathway TrbL component
MKQDFFNLFLIIAICFVAYLIFRHFNINTREGMVGRSTTTTTDSSSSSNGVAGGAAAYAANIKANSIKIHDQLLITKYRTDYENVILNLDDLVDNLMLETALTVDPTKPAESLTKIQELGQTKVALNSIMKFIDASS